MTDTKKTLSQRKCEPCEDTQSPLQRQEIINFLKDLTEWRVTEDDKTLYREFELKDFLVCVDVINKISQIAEKEGHHPNLYLRNYNKLKVELSTHAIGGLSDNDFIMASKINEIKK